MSKIVIFSLSWNDYLSDPFMNKTKEIFKDECLIWNSSSQKDLEYFIQNKDNRIYEKVLDYCFENNVEFLYIIYLLYPEYLMAELNVRKYRGETLKTKIIFGIDWRLIMISNARIKIMADLLQEDCIHSLINFSNLGPKASYPGVLCQEILFNNPKIKLFYTPLLVEIRQASKKDARIEYNLPQDKFILLFFGAMYYGKGIDLLLEAMKEVNENVLLFIVSGKGRINFSLDEKLLSQHNIIWRQENPDNSRLSGIFATSDCVVLPYRTTYKNCASSVLVQAIQTHKPVIMPSITPFKEVVKENNLGLLFEPENINSLTTEINRMYLEQPWFDRFSKFDDYISQIPSIENYIKMLFE